MRSDKSQRIWLWGFVALLAMAPLVRGGSQPWWFLPIVGGFLTLLALRWTRSFWTGSPSIVFSRHDALLLLVLLWVLFGASRPASPPEALDAFLIVLGCAGCFFLARALAFDGLALAFAMGLCAIGGSIALVGLFQTFGVLSHSWWNPPQFAAATFVNHNHFAAYLELLLPLGCALWLAARLLPAQRFVVAVSCTSMAIGLILSCSRGAWLSLAVITALCLGLFGLFQRRLLWSWRGVLVVALAVAAVGFLASQPPIVARGMSLLDVANDASFQTRQAIWQGTRDLAREHPLIGQGLGSFQFAFLPHRPDGLYRLIPYAFNEYLQLVAELGLVGLLLAVWWMLLVVGRTLWLIRQAHTPWKRTLGLGGLIGLGSVAVHSFIDYPWHIAAVAFTSAAIAGVLMGIGYHADPSPLRTVRWPGLSPRGLLLRWVATPLILASLGAVFMPLFRLVVADLWASRGQAHYETGKLAEAVASYQQAMRRVPWRSEYHRRLGDSLVQLAWQHGGYERRAHLTQAAEAYRKALALVPRDAWSAHALGEVLKAVGDFTESDRWFSQAIAHDPTNPLYWKHWGELSLIRGEGPKAAEAFRRAATFAKSSNFFPFLFASLDDPEHFIRLGDSALVLGRLTVAETAFTIARQFDPLHPASRIGLALCALHRGDVEAANRLAVPVQDPALRAKWLAGQALVFVNRRELDRAIAALDESLQIDPSNLLAHHLRVGVAGRLRDPVRAQQALGSLLALNRPPVFVKSGATAQDPLVIWEPEKGSYSQGKKTKGGWMLFNNSAIHQVLALPAGTVRVQVTASGTKAKGRWPAITLTWQGRPIKTLEVASEQWTTYEFDLEVKSGESLLTVSFLNDERDVEAGEDRNVKLDRVSVSWGAREPASSPSSHAEAHYPSPLL